MVISAISVIENLASDFQVSLYLIYRDLSQSVINMVVNFFEQRFATKLLCYQMPADKARIFTNERCPEKHISDAMFDRLFIHEIITDIDRAIYLDADTIVNGDLNELYAIDIGKSILGGVIEPGFDYKIEQYGYTATRLANLDIESHYFNSGVLLLNLVNFRHLDLIKLCQEAYVKYNNYLMWPEQDILNILFGTRTYFLPPKFNSEVYDNAAFAHEFYNYFNFYGKTVPYDTTEIQQAISNPTVIHFVGPHKPWIHPGDYFLHKEKYWKYYNLSPWCNEDSLLVEEKLRQHYAK
jgi:lipopolysaccharide biosynthesis glycosyltransferase